MAEIDDLLAEAYGPESRSTADVLEGMPQPSWHDRYVKPWGSASLAKQEPNWFGKNVLANPALQDAMLAANFLTPAMKVPRIPNPIKAYHGSPHDFDKFDMAKIGSGEGAQAYGHGLYFAEHEPVAKQYRNQLAGGELTVGGQPVRPGSPYWNDASELANIHAGDINAMIADLKAIPGYDWMGSGKKSARELRLEEMRDKGVSYTPNGKMYEVALHATPEQFLDWDKPLSGQSREVRKVLPPLMDRAAAVGRTEAAAGQLVSDPRNLDARSRVLCTSHTSRLGIGEGSSSFHHLGVPPGAGRPVSLFVLASGLLGLLYGGRGYALQRALKVSFVLAGLHLARQINELLTLGPGVFSGLGFRHGASRWRPTVGDLLAHREVRHG